MESSIFSVPRDLKFKTILITEIKFCSVRALKCYLNEKKLIHGRVNETNDLILNLTPENVKQHSRIE